MDDSRSSSERSRRRFLAGAIGACVVAPAARALAQADAGSTSALTKAQRDQMTPAQILDELKKGNERFRTGKGALHDYRDQQRTSANGQYPAAVVLGGIDSRHPPRSSSMRGSARRSTHGSPATS